MTGGRGRGEQKRNQGAEGKGEIVIVLKFSVRKPRVSSDWRYREPVSMDSLSNQQHGTLGFKISRQVSMS